MSSSCVFTFGESSIWDPKVIREHLNIPEDQLNILRNLPEWSKDKDNSNTFRIEKDITCESSQSSHLISGTALEKNKELTKQNIELFDKNFETRRSILEAYKLKAAKLSRSLSSFEIDKISSNLSSNSHLRSALSISDIYLFSKNICTEFKSIDSPERYLSSINKNTDLPVFKEIGVTYRADRTNKGSPELERSKGKTCEKSNMEVDSQLPVATHCLKDQVGNSETHTEIVESNAVPTSHTSKSSNELDISSSDQPTSLTSANKFDNGISGVNIKTTSDINLDEKNEKSGICIVVENIPSNSCNPEVTETVTKSAESKGLNSCGKNEPDLNVGETAHKDDDSVNEDKKVETNVVQTCIQNVAKSLLKLPECQEMIKLHDASLEMDRTYHKYQELVKSNKTSDQCPKSFGISKELCASKASLISSNESEIEISSNSNISKMDVEQTTLKDVSHNKSVFVETLSAKRKLESKNKSLKKRRKQSHHEERSVKKAGEICYSVEDIKMMLDIMKQFI